MSTSERLMTGGVCLIVAAMIGGCSRTAPSGAGGQGQPVSSPVAAATPAADSLRALVASLAEVEGSYRISEGGVWEFVGDRRLVEAIRAFGDSAVVQLVQCLDRADETRTLLNGRAVPLGVLCYEALSETAYHEAVDDYGDLDAEWEGYILPTASLDELRAARQAWEEVLAIRSYILYP
jgi:hypothetical protein